jgi:AcrR family transcriptional regulator
MSTKEQSIIEAATAEFLKHGFSAASVNVIAERANVSKRTLYRYYRSKEDLFRAVIIDDCHELMGSVSQFGNRSPRETLTAFGRSYVRLVTLAESLDLYRIVITEIERSPSLGLSFLAGGSENTTEELAAYLTKEVAAGRLRIANPRIAADQFQGMVLGSLRLRAFLGQRLTDAEIDSWVEQAVSLFLLGSETATGAVGMD